MTASNFNKTAVKPTHVTDLFEQSVSTEHEADLAKRNEIEIKKLNRRPLTTNPINGRALSAKEVAVNIEVAKKLQSIEGHKLTVKGTVPVTKEIKLKPAKIKKPPSGKLAVKTLPVAAYKNDQLDLFQRFLSNNNEAGTHSNAVDLWDCIPRYSVTRAKMEKMRTPDGFLPLLKKEFQHRGAIYAVQIRPARIEVRDDDGVPTGDSIEYYPSTREELVEHALRKLATEQAFGFLDQPNYRSGVTFTLYQLRKELENRGHAMKYAALVESLDIMNLANIRLLDKSSGQKDPSLVSQSYIPVLIKVNKENFAFDPEAKWLVQFHSALTVSINQITYRQFNYATLMNCKSQLSRWLISQLVLKYVQAALGNSFTMLYSTIHRDSGLLNYAQPRDSIVALDEAFEEIKSEGVLMSIHKEVRTGLRGKIEDVSYTLRPSAKFAKEQTAANKRKNDGQKLLSATASVPTSISTA